MLKFNFIINRSICALAEQKVILMNLKNGTMDKERLKTLAREE
jgi:hypothetical protein